MADPDHADNEKPGASEQGSAVHNYMRERLKPALDEVFDAYVIMGYVTENGQTRRVVAFNDTVVNGVPRNPVLADAMRRPRNLAHAWGTGQL